MAPGMSAHWDWNTGARLYFSHQDMLFVKVPDTCCMALVGPKDAAAGAQACSLLPVLAANFRRALFAVCFALSEPRRIQMHLSDASSVAYPVHSTAA